MEDIFISILGEENPELKKEVIEECWEFLKKDPELILDNFIIYVTRKHTYIIPPEGIGRIGFLEYLIDYFEAQERYERCAHLLKIKDKILGNINKF